MMQTDAEPKMPPGMTNAPLVVGYPRSGFTLLISVIAEIRNVCGIAAPDQMMGLFCAGAGAQVAARIEAVFQRHGLASDLLYNGNFKELAGGPKWLKPNAPGTACFRKYIGVRGLGDFTLITTHPSAVMDCYDVIHSHVAPAGWAAAPAYAPLQKFTSLRDPAGTLASACFSLNALASEYIQKFVEKTRDDDGLRQRLALYKLSDRRFFGALIGPYKAYLEEFVTVAGAVPVFPPPLVVRVELSFGDPVDHRFSLVRRLPRDRIGHEFLEFVAGHDHGPPGQERLRPRHAAPEDRAVPDRRAFVGVEPPAHHGMNAIGADQ